MAGSVPAAASPSGRGGTGESPVGWKLVVDAIGRKVRQLRQERGLTLQQLAHAADVSTASVHKVERGDMVPTITTMLKIAGALEVPVGHFVEDPDTGPSAVLRRWAATAGADDAGGIVVITGPTSRFRLSGTVTRIEPGARRRATHRAGETLIVVLSGSLSVVVDDENYRVTAGDALHVHAQAEQRWSNDDVAVVEAVWVTVPGS